MRSKHNPAVEFSAVLDQSDFMDLVRSVSKQTVTRAIQRSGSTSLRDMKSEASKRVRKLKRLKVKQVKRAIHVTKPSKSMTLRDIEWSVNITGEKVRLSDYPHRQTRKGVSVTVNKGKRTLISGAFVATLRSGHEGVFIRRGPRRLPIREMLGSRPVDALLHRGQAEGVAERGANSFGATMVRLLTKAKAK